MEKLQGHREVCDQTVSPSSELLMDQYRVIRSGRLFSKQR